MQKRGPEKHPILKLLLALGLKEQDMRARAEAACRQWNELAQTKNILFYRERKGELLSKDEIVNNYLLCEDAQPKTHRVQRRVKRRPRRPV
jgi:hypothetical protein